MWYHSPLSVLFLLFNLWVLYRVIVTYDKSGTELFVLFKNIFSNGLLLFLTCLPNFYAAYYVGNLHWFPVVIWLGSFIIFLWSLSTMDYFTKVGVPGEDARKKASGNEKPKKGTVGNGPNN